MKDGNGESVANVVTLCLKGEIPHCVSRKPPLDVARPRATLQVQEIIYFAGQPARTTGTRQSSAAEEISRGDAEPRRMKDGNGESVANGITLCLNYA